MRIFIDANILLDLYHVSGPDLDEVRKIIKLAEMKKIDVLFPAQICDEFWRNRERVISEALALFGKTKASATLPNIVRGYASTVELRAAVERTNELARDILREAEEEARDNALKADKLIEELFNRCPPKPISSDVLGRARIRRDLGNPPGKPNALGDAINWEWLLENIAAGEDLHIISADGDFESELTPGELRQFLIREWAELKKSGIELYKGLPEFFKKHFPDIKLSDEIEKTIAIENLERTFSFATTHQAIRALSKFDDFKDTELIRLLTAFDDNNQIAWILDDEDVKAFAKKLVALSKSDPAKAKSLKLAEKLDALDRIKDAGDLDDDIPF